MSGVAETRVEIVEALKTIKDFAPWAHRPSVVQAGTRAAWPEFNIDEIQGSPELRQGLISWSVCVFLAEPADDVNMVAISAAQLRADELCERAGGLAQLVENNIQSANVTGVRQEQGAEIGEITGILVTADVIILGN